MKKKALNLYDDDLLSDLWIGAFRYYLGRATIATHAFAEELTEKWTTIPPRARVVILRDLYSELDSYVEPEDSFSFSRLGTRIDAKKWFWVAEQIRTEYGEGKPL